MADLHPSRKFISPELPPDILLFHILPRLPAKSVLRFHSVCKQWRSFLKTPTFSDLHRHHERHKVLVMSTTQPYNFRTIDCEAPEDGLSAARSLPFKAKPENMEIITSLNGLVCVGIKKLKYDYVYSNFILWNPLTGECKTLSRTNSEEEYYTCTGRVFGLYYSCSEDDYKLLCVNYDYDVYIYSLKSDSWRKVESTLVDNNIQRVPYRFSGCWQESVVLNEKLYFMKRVDEGPLHTVPSYSIITFDMKTEKFIEIATPSFENRRIWQLDFMAVRGCIHLFVTYYITNRYSRVPFREIEIWRMDGKEDWKKVVTQIPPFPWFHQPLHVMKNRNLLLYSNEKSYVYKVCLETHTKEELCSYIGMDIPSSGKYVETFVSLDRYIK